MKIKDIIIDIVIVAVIVAVFSVFIKPIIVDGESMEPTLRNRDYLFLSRQAYHVGEPKRGQIVVFPKIFFLRSASFFMAANTMST